MYISTNSIYFPFAGFTDHKEDRGITGSMLSRVNVLLKALHALDQAPLIQETSLTFDH